MGNKQSSQSSQSSQNKQSSKQFQQHYSAGTKLPTRRFSSAALSTTSSASYAPPSAPPPPYLTSIRDSPTPNERQTAETRPPQMPSPKTIRRTQSNGAHDVPRRSQPLAGTGRVRMPAVPSTLEEVPPMPMPVPHPAPPPPGHVQFPVPPVSPALAEPLHRRKSKEDPLTMLRQYDTVIIVCLMQVPRDGARADIGAPGR